MRFESAAHARNYLFRTLRNLAADRRGRPAHRGLESAGSVPSRDTPPIEALARRESTGRLEAVRDAIRALSPRERELLRMRYAEGRTFREIARETGRPISTLHSRVESALKKVRAKLGKRPPCP